MNEEQFLTHFFFLFQHREEYQIILSLTDGKLGTDKFITQSLLLIVEDVNDNTPIFSPYESTILIEENSHPQVLAVLTATDKDEGPYGQVLSAYHICQAFVNVFWLRGPPAVHGKVKSHAVWGFFKNLSTKLLLLRAQWKLEIS